MTIDFFRSFCICSLGPQLAALLGRGRLQRLIVLMALVGMEMGKNLVAVLQAIRRCRRSDPKSLLFLAHHLFSLPFPSSN